MNFALSAAGRSGGIDHLGIEVQSAEELEGLRKQLGGAGIERHSEGEASCCYARSEKTWAVDPQGVRWEAFRTFGTHDALAGEGPRPPASAGCCGPTR